MVKIVSRLLTADVPPEIQAAMARMGNAISASAAAAGVEPQPPQPLLQRERRPSMKRGFAVTPADMLLAPTLGVPNERLQPGLSLHPLRDGRGGVSARRSPVEDVNMDADPDGAAASPTRLLNMNAMHKRLEDLTVRIINPVIVVVPLSRSGATIPLCEVHSCPCVPCSCYARVRSWLWCYKCWTSIPYCVGRTSIGRDWYG